MNIAHPFREETAEVQEFGLILILKRIRSGNRLEPCR